MAATGRSQAVVAMGGLLAALFGFAGDGSPRSGREEYEVTAAVSLSVAGGAVGPEDARCFIVLLRRTLCDRVQERKVLRICR